MGWKAVRVTGLIRPSDCRGSWQRLLLILAALGTVGCGQDADQARISDRSADTDPVPGGTAVVALATDPEVLNPLIYTSTTAGFVFAEMHDGLTEMGDDLLYHPRIAAGWEVAPDGMSVTYHLRPWRWSDGTPLTAVDVVASSGIFFHK